MQLINPLYLIIDLLTIWAVAFSCAVFSIIWEHVTKPQAIFGDIPNYYPDYDSTFIGKVIRCMECRSGWLAMLLMVGYRFSIAAWGLAIGFDNLSNLITYIIVQIVLSCILIAFSGVFGIWFVQKLK